MVYIAPAVAFSAAVVLLNAASGVSASPVSSSKAPSPFTTLTVASTQTPSSTSSSATTTRTCIPVPTINPSSQGRHARIPKSRKGRGRKGRSKLPLCQLPTQLPTSNTVADPSPQSEILTQLVQPTAGVQQTIAARARRGGIALSPEQQSKLAAIGAKAAEIFGGGSSTTTAEPTSTAGLVARRVKKDRGGKKGGIKLTSGQKERLAELGSKAAEIFKGEETSTTSVSSTTTAEGTQQTIAVRRTRRKHRPAKNQPKSSGVTLTPGQKIKLSAIGGKIVEYFRGEETTTTSSEASTSTSATVTSTAESPIQTA